MTDVLVRKNVCVHGHRTSLRLEGEIWDALDEICRLEGLNIHQLCSLVERQREGLNRTSSLRAFIVSYFREAATSEGHARAGHGRLAASSHRISLHGGAGPAAYLAAGS